MKRSITTWGLLFVAVGGMVGSGRLFGPYFAAQTAGPAATVAWILGGVLMILVALTFAELASSFPLTGGTIRYLQLSHGPVVSFTMAWIAWISSVAVPPIETMALLQYSSHYWPALMTPASHSLSLAGIIAAMIIMLIISAINAAGAKSLAKTNLLLVLIKLTVSIATIYIFISFAFHRANFVSAGFLPSGWHGVLAALPSAGVIFSYIGYSPAIQLAGETKNPQRALPIAIIGSLIICIILYTLLQGAFIGALNPSSITHGWSHMSFQGDASPLVGIMAGIGIVWFIKVMIFDAAFSPFGTALLFSGATARMCYAMGKNGYMPPAMMQLNKQGIPSRILALNFVLGMLMFLPFHGLQSMMSFLVSCLVFAYAVGPLSLMVLRQTLPNQPRPFKLPMPRTLSLLAFYICNMIIFWTGWQTLSKMIAVILFGYVALWTYSQTRYGRPLALEWRRSLWMVCYVCLLGLASYCGSFGGGTNLVHFGTDFALMGLITVAVFESAIRLGISTEQATEYIQSQA